MPFKNREIKLDYDRQRRLKLGHKPGSQRADWHGLGEHVHSLPLPTCPTTAQPGTPQKIAVMLERAKSHQQLFHPLDNSRLPNAVEMADAFEEEP